MISSAWSCPQYSLADLPQKRRTLYSLTREEMQNCQWLKPLFVAQIRFPRLRSLHNQFSDIKHGKALVLLDKDVIDKAVVVYNDALPALQIGDGPDFRTNIRCTLKNSPFQLSLACRQMIAGSLSKEAQTVEPIDPNYIMGWKGQCPGQP